MADVTVEKLKADSINSDELYTGNMVVTGAARFVQPIYADIKGSKDINTVNTGSISNSAYVLFSNGTNLFRVSYSDLINDLSTKVSITIADSEGVGY